MASHTIVRDAETGEELSIPTLLPKLNNGLSSYITLPPLEIAMESPNNHSTSSKPVYRETQSVRAMGTNVGWEKKQKAMVEVRK